MWSIREVLTATLTTLSIDFPFHLLFVFVVFSFLFIFPKPSGARISLDNCFACLLYYFALTSSRVLSHFHLSVTSGLFSFLSKAPTQPFPPLGTLFLPVAGGLLYVSLEGHFTTITPTSQTSGTIRSSAARLASKEGRINDISALYNCSIVHATIKRLPAASAASYGAKEVSRLKALWLFLWRLLPSSLPIGCGGCRGGDGAIQ